MSEKDILRIEVEGAELWLTSPYKPAFIEELRGLHGRWNAELKKWRFRISALEPIRALCLRFFGREPEILFVAPMLTGDDRVVESLEMMPTTIETTPQQQAIKLARRLAPFMKDLDDLEREHIYELLFMNN